MLSSDEQQVAEHAIVCVACECVYVRRSNHNCHRIDCVIISYLLHCYLLGIVYIFEYVLENVALVLEQHLVF